VGGGGRDRIKEIHTGPLGGGGGGVCAERSMATASRVPDETSVGSFPLNLAAAHLPATHRSALGDLGGGGLNRYGRSRG